MFRKATYTILFIMMAKLCFSQPSVLSSGNWYKVAVEKTGVYRLNADQLRRLGLDIGKTDPRKIRVFGARGGMLPQPNDAPRDGQLREIAIKVHGEDDGAFNGGDYILFYAEGPDRDMLIPEKGIFSYQRNLYTDKNFYFINVSQDNGKRIGETAAGSGGMSITTYQDYFYYEKDEHNELRSGREWYGERFETTPNYTFGFEADGIIENSPIYFVSDVMSQSVSPSKFDITFNNEHIGEQSPAVIPGSQYGVKGRHSRDTLMFTASTVSATQTKQQIEYSFTKGATGRSTGFLNFFSVHFTRQLALTSNQVRFRNSESLNQHSQYTVSNANADFTIWDVSDPYSVNEQKFSLSNGSAIFSREASGSVPEFVAFNRNTLSPLLVGKVNNQDLTGMTTPNMVIITHPLFQSAAERLAQHRAQINGWTVRVVTTDEVYNEFSSGRQDVTAIRDFAKHMFDKNPSVLKALLLFGKCSYDYRDYTAGNTNFVPTYESRNSLSPLETYSSDDYFGFLESNEGEWGENPFVQNHTLDIAVGRLPLKTVTEADVVVNKLIEYDIDQKRFGKWRKEIVFVADDGSNADGFTSIHQSQASSLADNIEQLNPEFDTRKIFLGAYPKIVSPNGESIPKANKDIAKEFHQSVIINYIGHGSEKLWADERVLSQEEIEKLDNRIYPFLVTATCEFGRHDNPLEISSAELSLLREKSGSIGLVTTARPVNSSTNFSLNAAFYEALLIGEGNTAYSVGQIFQNTKNNSMSGVANRNFSLLGDPSMRLALPPKRIFIDEIRTSSGSDTLKALSTVRVKGVIKKDGNVQTDFNGLINATLFDKRTRFKTIGKNDPAFSFDQWYNPLFRGQASVKNGAFEFEFTLPKNIAYEINYGKLSLYAFNDTKTEDACGANLEFKIGGSEDLIEPDDTSPIVNAYMEDETFVNGGSVNSNTRLVVRVKDDHGINISNYGIGNTMMAVLDEDAEVFLLNEYFTSDLDNPAWGWIDMPIKDLSPGRHRLTVKVWDLHNNPAEARVDFMVTDGDGLFIEAFGNYPNPIDSETTLFFTHNRAGEDLQAQLRFMDATGRELQTFMINVPASAYTVEVMQLDLSQHFDKKLTPGLYFCHLRVRSMADGSGSERVTKLVVSN